MNDKERLIETLNSIKTLFDEMNKEEVINSHKYDESLKRRLSSFKNILKEYPHQNAQDAVNIIASILDNNKLDTDVPDKRRNILSTLYSLPITEDDWKGLDFDNNGNITKKEINDFGPTGIANPADYMQTIKFTDSDEDGKPESVEIEKKSDETVSDERLKDISDANGKEQEDIRQKRIDHFKENWGETDEQKRRKGKL